jgi:hypothetical protein
LPHRSNIFKMRTHVKMLPRFGKKINAQQRKIALTFCSDCCAVTLLIMRVALEPLAGLMRHLFFVRSAAWEKTQWAKVAAGKARCYRITEAWSGALTSAFFVKLQELMFTQVPWALLSPAQMTSRNLSSIFATCCSAGGGIHFQFQRDHRRHPCKLFGLLVAGDRARHAVSILADPPCLRDELATAIIRVYPTVERLCSGDCLAILACLAVMLDLDTADVECRHAWVRRHLLAKSFTWFSESGETNLAGKLRTLQYMLVSRKR